MNTFIDSRQISISSSSADFLFNGTFKSSVGFSFFGMLQDESDILQAQLSVHSAQIPISYYVVNIYNHTLKYKIGNGAITTATFDVGNYNANTFISEMKNKITNITTTFNRINGKFNFSASSPITFYSDGSTCFKILGLDASQDYSGNTIVAPYPCQFQGITRIRIVSNTFSTYSMDSLAGTFSNTLATIAVNSGSYGILLYENTTGYKPTLRNTIINDFDISLLDDDENLINFNNVDWNITLQLDITRIRRENNKIFPNFKATLPLGVSRELLSGDAEQGISNENKQTENDDERSSNIPLKRNENLNTSTDSQEIPETQDVPILESTGDDDLDFLLYQQNIFQ